MVDRDDVTPMQPGEAHAAAVERDNCREVDPEADAAAVELADGEPRWLDADENPAVHGRRGGSGEVRRDEGGADQHQPEPSHAQMLSERGQRAMWAV
jgi:hypothetical protein